ncbi:MAG: hypothetical protein ACRBCK_01265 [Alphaproteobacteria bacterium]
MVTEIKNNTEQGVLSSEQFNTAVLPKAGQLQLLVARHELDPENPDLSKIKNVKQDTIILEDNSEDSNVTFSFEQPCLFLARQENENTKYLKADAFKGFPTGDDSQQMLITFLNGETERYDDINPSTDEFVFISPKDGTLNSEFIEIYNDEQSSLVGSQGNFALVRGTDSIAVNAQDLSFTELFATEPPPQYDDDAPEQNAPEA